MPKYEPLPPISGAEAFMSLLTFLQDTKAVEARLRDLLHLHTEINAAVARAGKAEEIEALHAAALADRQKAADELRASREKAADTVKAAFAARDAALKEAAEVRALIAEARAALMQEQERWQRERESRETALRTKEQEIDGALKSALADRDAAAQARLEWAEKVERLKAAGVV